MHSYSEDLKNILNISRKLLTENQNLISKTGNINSKGDETLEIDEKIEQEFIKYIKNNKLPFNIYSEEIGYVKHAKNTDYTLVFDPLDGSSNYRFGKNLFPYGTLISLYKGPKLSDIIFSGAYEHTTNSMWLYEGQNTIDLYTGEKVTLKNDWKISKSTQVFFDLYYKENFKKLINISQKLHVMWGGSNISSLLYILTNRAPVMGAGNNKPEEIGALYTLIKGAGGKTVDFRGEKIGNLNFEINTDYELISGDSTVVDYLLNNLTT